MLVRALALLLALATLAPATPPLASQGDADVAAGVGLVKQGDFEGAIVRLDAAIRRLEDQGRNGELAQAYLFLGVAFLELDQEALARGKFAQALAHQPELQLDPREFSPQVIRTFETARQEAPPADPDNDKAAGVVPSAAGEVAERPKRRSALPFLILGGAAAAGGLALASGGGAAATPTPSPQPSATPTPTPTATPTPPPQQQPCSFSATPRRFEFPASGGRGTCRISASRSDCTWNAESTAPSWLLIDSGAAGRGSADVEFTVRANPSDDDDRRAEIRLRQAPGASCEVRQDRDRSAAPLLVSWASDLALPGASGRILVDGGLAALHGTGFSQAERRVAPGPLRIEAVLVSASGPGVWRFRFAGGLRPGTLRVLAGAAASVSADAIVFRLRGLPGERVAFSLVAGR